MDPSGRGDITVFAPDGTIQGKHVLEVLLAGVDESIYSNVFAIGIRELQELATLNDTEAARQLYNLTGGLDRVSLVDVMRELETSRERIFARAEKSSRISRARAISSMP